MSKYVYLMNGEDSETHEWSRRLTTFTPLTGGRLELGRVGNGDLLALLAHGTAEMAVCVKKGTKKRWTPGEVVNQLVSDGLSKTHRDIELFVCEAGSSVNTVKNANQLGKLRDKYLATKNPAKQEIISKQFEKKAAVVPTMTNMAGWSTKYLLPFAAALVQEMKNRKFTNIRIICYKFCLSSHFTEGVVWLQDPALGDRKATEADKVRWL